ncbi:MAG: TIGR01777 family protein, partial [Verrucomicrobia bacterium]|nr:TIGR01777 family protein [Verrucomicrobiota bacterium]
MSQKIILAGGSGFLGQALAQHFKASGDEVVVLTRSPARANGDARFVQWNGKTSGAWTRELDGATAVVNLSGRSVDCRYTPVNRQEIMDSRVLPTRALGEAIARCGQPPRAWLNAATATIYQHSLERANDEATGAIGGTAAAKDEFSVEVAQAWEAAFDQARTPATRHVTLRLAMVLGLGRNSVFPVLRRLARFGLGGAMGGGRQFVSWIHVADFCRAIEWLIARDDLAGPVNLVAPNPLTNREMMRAFREVCGAPFGLPATRWMLEVGAFLLRTETELMIKSRRVVPGRLLAAGFEFRF